jgi:hypothetical protein
MPVYGTVSPSIVSMSPGDVVELFNAETPAIPSNSIVITPGVGVRNLEFQSQFAAAATASLLIEGSNVSPTASSPQDGLVLYTSTNKQADSYNDANGLAFYWANLSTQTAGGAVSVIVRAY